MKRRSERISASSVVKAERAARKAKARAEKATAKAHQKAEKAQMLAKTATIAAATHASSPRAPLKVKAKDKVEAAPLSPHTTLHPLPSPSMSSPASRSALLPQGFLWDSASPHASPSLSSSNTSSSGSQQPVSAPLPLLPRGHDPPPAATAEGG
ncbi:hypothetical protein CcaverHIS002_0305620 [Cutaneotrichosporon cavernicola]|nr:hypothetical protein CcaverHIS002_0305620 [Cutaneotrichosporon cavernicola]